MWSCYIGISDLPTFRELSVRRHSLSGAPKAHLLAAHLLAISTQAKILRDYELAQGYRYWGAGTLYPSKFLLRCLSRLSAASVLGAKLPGPSRNRTPFAEQGHRHPTSRRLASSVSTSRLTLAPPGPAIIPLGSIEDGLLRRDSYASLQTRHQLGTVQIATSKW